VNDLVNNDLAEVFLFVLALLAMMSARIRTLFAITCII